MACLVCEDLARDGLDAWEDVVCPFVVWLLTDRLVSLWCYSKRRRRCRCRCWAWCVRFRHWCMCWCCCRSWRECRSEVWCLYARWVVIWFDDVDRGSSGGSVMWGSWWMVGFFNDGWQRLDGAGVVGCVGVLLWFFLFITPTCVHVSHGCCL